MITTFIVTMVLAQANGAAAPSSVCVPPPCGDNYWEVKAGGKTLCCPIVHGQMTIRLDGNRQQEFGARLITAPVWCATTAIQHQLVLLQSKCRAAWEAKAIEAGNHPDAEVLRLNAHLCVSLVPKLGTASIKVRECTAPFEIRCCLESSTLSVPIDAIGECRAALWYGQPEQCTEKKLAKVNDRPAGKCPDGATE